MPVIVTSDEKPTFIAKPDMRFATTFLSQKFRDYSVAGESLMDKATGEIFVKRPDGRVVSFFENKKYMYDIAFKLNTMIHANHDLQYDRENKEGYFISVDYDSMSIFNEKRLDTLTTDVVFPNDEGDTTTNVKFNISLKSNAFFIRPVSRDSDKNIIEFLTHEYNKRFENYTGDNVEYVQEADKFTDIPKWKDSNAGIEYTVKVTKGETEQVYTMTDFIRINEESCVYIPYNRIRQDFPYGIDSCLVTIKSITYYKIHFMVEHLIEFGEEFNRVYQEFLTFDHEMFIDYYNISYFLDDTSELLFFGNEFVLFLMDIPFMQRYVNKTNSILQRGGTILSTQRPVEEEWPISTVWAERVRDIYTGHEVIDRGSETNVSRLEATLGTFNYVAGTEITTDPTSLNDFLLLTDNGEPYTTDEVNGMLTALYNRFNSNAENVVVRSETRDTDEARHRVTEKGVVLATEFTTESEDPES